MSKRRKQRSKAGRSSRGKKSRRTPSLTIPIIVGLVVIVVLAGVIASLASQQSSARTAGTSGSGTGATAQPLATVAIPYPEVPRITLEETQERLDLGQAILVDVRSRDAYDRAHAAGALSIPEPEIESRLSELPTDELLVLY